MRAFVLFLLACLAVGATVASFATPAAEPPTVIDAQSPGAWPDYAAARESDLMCIHVPTPRAMRRYPKEVQT